MKSISAFIFFIAFLSPCLSQSVQVKMRADSQAPGYEIHKAMDNDPKTIWHTEWSGYSPPHPHEVFIDLGKEYPIIGLSYLPRQDGSDNGTIQDFEVRISNRAMDPGAPIYKGAFSNTREEKIIRFPAPCSGRYFSLITRSDVRNKGWASIAELKILSDGVSFIGAPHVKFKRSEAQVEWENLVQDIRRIHRFKEYADQTYCDQALIFESDRDPADVILRRTRALLEDLQSKQDMALLSEQLEKLCARSIPIDEVKQRFELFEKLRKLRREIAFSNPLLDFDRILFLKRKRSSFNHMCDQYYGINAMPGGGLFLLHRPFGPNPQVTPILEQGGSYVSPDLDFDGKRIAFAHVKCQGTVKHDHHTDPSRGHWCEDRCYHIFTVNWDGTDLKQLTRGTFNDFDPCWLPSGRMAFISERRGGYLRCGRVCPTYTLHDMAADGSDIRCLSPHETNEWHPSVTHNGSIVYTRWDYVDRHGCTAHHPWITTADGRNSRAVHGNFSPRELRPDMELDIRAIPHSHRFVATAAPHHGQAFGSLVMIDPRVWDDDAMSPLKRLTPEVAFPETQGGAQVYGTPWPLSEKYYLVAYDGEMKPHMGGQGSRYVPGDYGLYLMDVYGNRELIYRDPQIPCQNPIPLRPRPRPCVAPNPCENNGRNEGVLALVDAYQSLKPMPKGVKIKSLRVYQILPMSVPSGSPPHEIGLRLPTGADSVILSRYVLGEVPIEEDGSAHFKVPANKELFFQVLDEEGLAIQSMRSATYVKPGEFLSCQGCHEPQLKAPELAKSQAPLAFQRPPSDLKPDVDGSNPFSYPRLVQPVLDRQCLKCHQQNPDKAPRLDSAVIAKGKRKWYASYFSLAPEYGFWKYGDRHRTTPGKFGARASKLYKLLKEGHHDVTLTKEEMHRITLWLDSCSVFYGVYEKEGGEAQLRGEVVKPTLE